VQLVLGTAQLTRPYGVMEGEGGHKPPGGNPEKVLHLAKNLGFSAIDTAPVYGNAEAEIGNANVNLEIHTKLLQGLGPASSVDQSLSRLRRARVDVVYLHETLSLEREQLRLLLELAGLKGTKVGRIGVSIYDRQEFSLAVSSPLVDVIQVPYNIFDQRFGPQCLSEAKEAGKIVVARSVFLQGVLLADPAALPAPVQHLSTDVARLRSIAHDWRIDPLTIALAFVRANTALSSIIVGAAKQKEMRDISQAFAIDVPKELVEELRKQDWPAWQKTDPRRWLA
jgi:aryl-alcohol dehydrogenase-like predicted oxidoreductase